MLFVFIIVVAVIGFVFFYISKKQVLGAELFPEQIALQQSLSGSNVDWRVSSVGGTFKAFRDFDSGVLVTLGGNKIGVGIKVPFTNFALLPKQNFSFWMYAYETLVSSESQGSQYEFAWFVNGVKTDALNRFSFNALNDGSYNKSVFKLGFDLDYGVDSRGFGNIVTWSSVSSLPVNYSIGFNWFDKTVNSVELRYRVGQNIDSLPFNIVFSFNVWKESDLCSLPSGYLLANESFSAGSIVSKAGLRYPVESFCRLTPIIKIRTDGVIDKSFKEYELLDAGQSVIVPDGMVYQFFYVIKANSQLMYVCRDLNLSFDAGKSACSVPVGIVSICSQGVFDVQRGTCTTQSLTPCDFGYYENGVCVFTPPQNFDCARDFSGSKFDLDSLKCELPMGTTFDCPNSTVPNLDRKVCEWQPRTICNSSLRATYNASVKQCEFNPRQFCPDKYWLNWSKSVCETSVADKCPMGWFWNDSISKCVGSVNPLQVCPIGFGFNFLSGKCDKQPSVFNLCPEGYEFDGFANNCFKAVEPELAQIVSLPKSEVVINPVASEIFGVQEPALASIQVVQPKPVVQEISIPSVIKVWNDYWFFILLLIVVFIGVAWFVFFRGN